VGATGEYVKYMILLHSLFFPNGPGGHTPPPIFTQNGLDDEVHVPFTVKSKLLQTPDLQAAKPPKFGTFVVGMKIFARFRLN